MNLHLVSCNWTVEGDLTFSRSLKLFLEILYREEGILLNTLKASKDLGRGT